MEKRKVERLPSVTIPGEAREPEPDLQRLTIMLYGPKGVGKSTLAAGFPDALFLAGEPGQKFLRVRMVNCLTWLAFKAAILELTDMKKRKDPKFPATLIVDGLDSLAQSCFSYSCEKHGMSYPSDEGYGKGWDLVRKEFAFGMESLLALDTGVVFIAHAADKTVTIDSIEQTKLFPNLKPFMLEVVAPKFDLTLYMSVGTMRNAEGKSVQVRTLRCRPSRDVDAGGRLPTMPKTLIIPEKEGFLVLQKAIADSMPGRR